MARPRLIVLPSAEEDLISIENYIAAEGGTRRARNVIDKINRALWALAYMPGLGRLRFELDGGPRTFAVRPWIIIYEPSDDGVGIIVWRVLDGRRDLPNVLRAPKR